MTGLAGILVCRNRFLNFSLGPKTPLAPAAFQVLMAKRKDLAADWSSSEERCLETLVPSSAWRLFPDVNENAQ